MRKSEIFAGILADVSSEAEIDSDRILSSERKEEVVDARYLVIFLLLGNGFYPAMIAERMGDDATCSQKRNIRLRDTPRELVRATPGMPEARRKMDGIEREAIDTLCGTNRLTIKSNSYMFVVRCTRAKTAEGKRGG